MNNDLISDKLFKKFSVLFYNNSGIELKSHKKYLLVNRLCKFIGEDKKFKSFEDYYEYLTNSNDQEVLTSFVNILTTNFSFFFREEVHFNFLKYYLQNKITDNSNVSIWSAACSSGEEPYSIAMTYLQTGINSQNINFKILATDISTKVLDFAQEGIYDLNKIQKTLDKYHVTNFFTKISDDKIKVNDNLKNLIYFRKLNLLDHYPFKKNFNIVFLRNVLIYFNNNEKQMILNKIYEYIKPKGYIILGLSESLVGIKTNFKQIKYSIYKKE